MPKNKKKLYDAKRSIDNSSRQSKRFDAATSENIKSHRVASGKKPALLGGKCYCGYKMLGSLYENWGHVVIEDYCDNGFEATCTDNGFCYCNDESKPNCDCDDKFNSCSSGYECIIGCNDIESNSFNCGRGRDKPCVGTCKPIINSYTEHNEDYDREEPPCCTEGPGDCGYECAFYSCLGGYNNCNTGAWCQNSSCGECTAGHWYFVPSTCICEGCDDGQDDGGSTPCSSFNLQACSMNAPGACPGGMNDCQWCGGQCYCAQNNPCNQDETDCWGEEIFSDGSTFPRPCENFNRQQCKASQDGGYGCYWCTTTQSCLCSDEDYLCPDFEATYAGWGWKWVTVATDLTPESNCWGNQMSTVCDNEHYHLWKAKLSPTPENIRKLHLLDRSSTENWDSHEWTFDGELSADGINYIESTSHFYYETLPLDEEHWFCGTYSGLPEIDMGTNEPTKEECCQALYEKYQNVNPYWWGDESAVTSPNPLIEEVFMPGELDAVNWNWIGQDINVTGDWNDALTNSTPDGESLWCCNSGNCHCPGQSSCSPICCPDYDGDQIMIPDLSAHCTVNEPGPGFCYYGPQTVQGSWCGGTGGTGGTDDFTSTAYFYPNYYRHTFAGPNMPDGNPPFVVKSNGNGIATGGQIGNPVGSYMITNYQYVSDVNTNEATLEFDVSIQRNYMAGSHPFCRLWQSDEINPYFKHQGICDGTVSCGGCDDIQTLDDINLNILGFELYFNMGIFLYNDTDNGFTGAGINSDNITITAETVGVQDGGAVLESESMIIYGSELYYDWLCDEGNCYKDGKYRFGLIGANYSNASSIAELGIDSDIAYLNPTPVVHMKLDFNTPLISQITYEHVVAFMNSPACYWQNQFVGSTDNINPFDIWYDGTQVPIALYYNFIPNTATGSCTDQDACNYNPLAVDDDGSCLYPVEYCQAYLGNTTLCDVGVPFEFYCTGDEPDGWILAGPVDTPGCTDPAASNFEENATQNDGSCIYLNMTCNNDGILYDNFNTTEEGGKCWCETDMANTGNYRCVKAQHFRFGGDIINFDIDQICLSGGINIIDDFLNGKCDPFRAAADNWDQSSDNVITEEFAYTTNSLGNMSSYDCDNETWVEQDWEGFLENDVFYALCVNQYNNHQQWVMLRDRSASYGGTGQVYFTSGNAACASIGDRKWCTTEDDGSDKCLTPACFGRCGNDNCDDPCTGWTYDDIEFDMNNIIHLENMYHINVLEKQSNCISSNCIWEESDLSCRSPYPPDTAGNFDGDQQLFDGVVWMWNESTGEWSATTVFGPQNCGPYHKLIQSDCVNLGYLATSNMISEDTNIGINDGDNHCLCLCEDDCGEQVVRRGYKNFFGDDAYCYDNAPYGSWLGYHRGPSCLDNYCGVETEDSIYGVMNAQTCCQHVCDRKITYGDTDWHWGNVKWKETNKCRATTAADIPDNDPPNEQSTEAAPYYASGAISPTLARWWEAFTDQELDNVTSPQECCAKKYGPGVGDINTNNWIFGQVFDYHNDYNVSYETDETTLWSYGACYYNKNSNQCWTSWEATFVECRGLVAGVDDSDSLRRVTTGKCADISYCNNNCGYWSGQSNPFSHCTNSWRCDGSYSDASAQSAGIGGCAWANYDYEFMSAYEAQESDYEGMCISEMYGKECETNEECGLWWTDTGMVIGDCVKSPGCIDPTADNYNATATYDDGSCTYAESGDDNGDDNGDDTLDNQDCEGEPEWGVCDDISECHVTIMCGEPGWCGLQPGCVGCQWDNGSITSGDIGATDDCYSAYGTISGPIDNRVWEGNSCQENSDCGWWEYESIPNITTSPAMGFCLKPAKVCGCMDPDAVNYNPNANVDDDSCDYYTLINYDPGCGEQGIGSIFNAFPGIIYQNHCYCECTNPCGETISTLLGCKNLSELPENDSGFTCGSPEGEYYSETGTPGYGIEADNECIPHCQNWCDSLPTHLTIPDQETVTFDAADLGYVWDGDTTFPNIIDAGTPVIDEQPCTDIQAFSDTYLSSSDCLYHTPNTYGSLNWGEPLQVGVSEFILTAVMGVIPECQFGVGWPAGLNPPSGFGPNGMDPTVGDIPVYYGYNGMNQGCEGLDVGFNLDSPICAETCAAACADADYNGVGVGSLVSSMCTGDSVRPTDFDPDFYDDPDCVGQPAFGYGPDHHCYWAWRCIAPNTQIDNSLCHCKCKIEEEQWYFREWENQEIFCCHDIAYDRKPKMLDYQCMNGCRDCSNHQLSCGFNENDNHCMCTCQNACDQDPNVYPGGEPETIGVCTHSYYNDGYCNTTSTNPNDPDYNNCRQECIDACANYNGHYGNQQIDFYDLLNPAVGLNISLEHACFNDLETEGFTNWGDSLGSYGWHCDPGSDILAPGSGYSTGHSVVDVSSDGGQSWERLEGIVEHYGCDWPRSWLMESGLGFSMTGWTDIRVLCKSDAPDTGQNRFSMCGAPGGSLMDMSPDIDFSFWQNPELLGGLVVGIPHPNACGCSNPGALNFNPTTLLPGAEPDDFLCEFPPGGPGGYIDPSDTSTESWDYDYISEIDCGMNWISGGYKCKTSDDLDCNRCFCVCDMQHPITENLIGMSTGFTPVTECNWCSEDNDCSSVCDDFCQCFQDCGTGSSSPLPTESEFYAGGSYINESVYELWEEGYVINQCWNYSGDVMTYANSCFDTYPGCGDPTADNFESNWTFHDCLSCEYTGCMDPDADNFNPQATIDDGSCTVYGCTDSDACNFMSNANTDDGSCWTNTWYEDTDGDTYGCPTLFIETCINPDPDLYVDNADGDCDDCPLAYDDCGVCGGDNSSCTGCTDITTPNGCGESCDGACNALNGCDPNANPGEVGYCISDNTCIYVGDAGFECNCQGTGLTSYWPDADSDGLGCCSINNMDQVQYFCDNPGVGYSDTCGEYDQFCECPEDTHTLDDCNVCYNMAEAPPNQCVGCTNPFAINYSVKHSIDDGSCIFDWERDPIYIKIWYWHDDGFCFSPKGVCIYETWLSGPGTDIIQHESITTEYDCVNIMLTVDDVLTSEWHLDDDLNESYLCNVEEPEMDILYMWSDGSFSTNLTDDGDSCPGTWEWNSTHTSLTFTYSFSGTTFTIMSDDGTSFNYNNLVDGFHGERVRYDVQPGVDGVSGRYYVRAWDFHPMLRGAPDSVFLDNVWSIDLYMDEFEQSDPNDDDGENRSRPEDERAIKTLPVYESNTRWHSMNGSSKGWYEILPNKFIMHYTNALNDSCCFPELSVYDENSPSLGGGLICDGYDDNHNLNHSQPFPGCRSVISAINVNPVSYDINLWDSLMFYGGEIKVDPSPVFKRQWGSIYTNESQLTTDGDWYNILPVDIGSVGSISSNLFFKGHAASIDENKLLPQKNCVGDVTLSSFSDISTIKTFIPYKEIELMLKYILNYVDKASVRKLHRVKGILRKINYVKSRISTIRDSHSKFLVIINNLLDWITLNKNKNTNVKKINYIKSIRKSNSMEKNDIYNKVGTKISQSEENIMKMSDEEFYTHYEMVKRNLSGKPLMCNPYLGIWDDCEYKCKSLGIKKVDTNENPFDNVVKQFKKMNYELKSNDYSSTEWSCAFWALKVDEDNKK